MSLTASHHIEWLWKCTDGSKVD